MSDDKRSGVIIPIRTEFTRPSSCPSELRFTRERSRCAKASITANGPATTPSACMKCITSTSTTPSAIPRVNRYFSAIQVQITGKDANEIRQSRNYKRYQQSAIGQVIYCCWCDPEGKVIDDGTIRDSKKMNIAGPLPTPVCDGFGKRPGHGCADRGYFSEKVAALALQGPTSEVAQSRCRSQYRNLKYFRVTRGKIAGVPVDISRTGYTGDLGFEIWMPWSDA